MLLLAAAAKSVEEPEEDGVAAADVRPALLCKTVEVHSGRHSAVVGAVGRERRAKRYMNAVLR